MQSKERVLVPLLYIAVIIIIGVFYGGYRLIKGLLQGSFRAVDTIRYNPHHAWRVTTNWLIVIGLIAFVILIFAAVH